MTQKLQQLEREFFPPLKAIDRLVWVKFIYGTIIKNSKSN